MELCELVTACLPFLTEDVHGIPEDMPIVERYSVAVELDFALSGLIAVPAVTNR